MSRRRWLILGIATGIIGSLYEFVPRKIIKSTAEFLLFDVDVFGRRIRQNDLILLGAILLIISFVSFYKAYKMSKSQSAEKDKIKSISGRRKQR